jgi:hypothetical protein
LLEPVDSGHVPNSTLQAWLRKNGIVPSTTEITSMDLWNFWKRAIMYTNRKKDMFLKNKEANKLLGLKSFDTNEEIAFGKIDKAALKCKEKLCRVLQEGNSGWQLELYLERLKSSSPLFDFCIAWDENSGRPTGVVWMTAMVQYYWIRYGNVLFIDSKKKKLHTLDWPYIGPTVVDNENIVSVICESLILQEAHEAYDCVLESLYEMEPHRSCQSTKLIFADGFLTDQVLTDLGLQKTTLFLDQYHMMNEIWPKEFGERIYAIVSGLL